MAGAREALGRKVKDLINATDDLAGHIYYEFLSDSSSDTGSINILCASVAAIGSIVYTAADCINRPDDLFKYLAGNADLKAYTVDMKQWVDKANDKPEIALAYTAFLQALERKLQQRVPRPEIPMGNVLKAAFETSLACIGDAYESVRSAANAPDSRILHTGKKFSFEYDLKNHLGRMQSLLQELTWEDTGPVIAKLTREITTRTLSQCLEYIGYLKQEATREHAPSVAEACDAATQKLSQTDAYKRLEAMAQLKSPAKAAGAAAL